MGQNVPDISVIIVSYNTADLTVACLESVFTSQRVGCEVFVVDNASKDGSAEIVRKKFPSVRLVVNTTNRGFGAANNQVLRECTGRYVVFLNPDAIVGPESLCTAAAFMDEHPEVGLAGPKVLNPDGTRQDSVSSRYPGHRYGAADLGSLPGDIACVLGACQIVRVSLLHDLGGFDEDFFLYGEDQDLCLRVRKRGYKIGFIDEAVIRHYGGQSELNTLPAEVVRKKVRAEHLFYRKHYRPATVRRIRRAKHFRALWRILSLRVLYLITTDKVSALQKLARYQVIREETRGPAAKCK
jgi:GT2 family glycosyltransferase